MVVWRQNQQDWMWEREASTCEARARKRLARGQSPVLRGGGHGGGGEGGAGGPETLGSQFRTIQPPDLVSTELEPKL